MPAKCPCGCGQSPATTTRLRKIVCPCGESILRLSRKALDLIHADCRACGGPLEPECLLDRVAAGDTAAVDILEARYDAQLESRAMKMPGRRAVMFKCGNCQAIRKASGPCRKCGETHPPTTSYMHPRAARVAGGDMPF